MDNSKPSQHAVPSRAPQEAKAASHEGTAKHVEAMSAVESNELVIRIKIPLTS